MDWVSNIFFDELTVAKQNKKEDIDDFESYIDLFDSERSEKDYDWMSDISIPEFPAHMLTQSSIDVAQYFKTRDFIEAYIEDKSAKPNAEAAKECINRTLNQRHLHHYPKYVRGKTINHLSGSVWLECWWEQDIREKVTGIQEVPLEVIDGVIRYEDREVRERVIIKDRFNYDVLDHRNVWSDNSYAYTAQDKKFIFIRKEKTLDELKAEADIHGYFDLDKLKGTDQTETSRETKEKQDPVLKNNKPMDIYKRYGKFWCKVVKRDENGEPELVKPGLDDYGEPLADAELHEVVITYAVSDSTKVMIGFDLQICVDADGNVYRPIIRGLCYIHPTRDSGTGDGQLNRELQIAIDDTFNMSNDRVRLATMPTLKGRKYAIEDNNDIYFEPNHVIPLENPDDLQEITISDNIGGALNQAAMLIGSMDKTMSIYPTTMGQQVAASTTATAIAGAESRTDMRTNYKSMTFENTALVELYWMIQQMTYQFATEETGFKLMGDKLYDFDPSKNYYYKPVSASIETDQSKDMKINRYTQLIGYTSNIGHPDSVKIVNGMLKRVYQLMGDEYEEFALLDEETPIQSGSPSQAGQGMVATNQTGIPQTIGERSVRGY